METLERATILGYGMVEFPVVYISRDTKTHMMGHPVTYSTQFDGERSVSVNLKHDEEYLEDEATVTLEGTKVTITNISEEANEIHLRFEANSQDENFYAGTDCVIPIVWY